MSKRMGPWTGGVSPHPQAEAGAAKAAIPTDPMTVQMRIISASKSKLFSDARDVENDELAIQLSNAMALASIAISLQQISKKLDKCAVGQVTSLDDLRKTFSSVFNLLLQGMVRAS